jgi:ketosteroid isomerase-like protein
MKIEKERLLKRKKESYQLVGRYTAFLESQEGNWQVVHEHMSVPDKDLLED